MRVVVIGSGLAGVTTARFLVTHGCEVVVLERAAGAGLETSYANAGMLTPSQSGPWNAPGVWRQLLGHIGREDAALLLRLRALPGLGAWGVKFLLNSRAGPYRRNTLSNLRLARYSMTVHRSLVTEDGIQYSGSRVGTMKVFRDEAAFRGAVAGAEALAQHGVRHIVQSRDGICAVEPALAPVAAGFVGGIHYPDDEAGDAHAFTRDLAGKTAARGVEFRYDTDVRTLELDGARLSAVQTSEGRICADAVVVAAGSHSVRLLAQVGIDLPVRPVKGYSITVPCRNGMTPPRVPVVDEGLHAAVTPLGERLRVAGTAEFTGYDHGVKARRIENLFGLLNAVYPALGSGLDAARAAPWAGLRPMSADGVPILGTTPIENLYLNTGHGHLGWTMAAGSGKAVADAIVGCRPEIDLGPYALARA